VSIVQVEPWPERVLVSPELVPAAHDEQILEPIAIRVEEDRVDVFIETIDRQRWLTGAFIAAALFNIGANLLAVPVFGIYGAAAVTVLSELVLLGPFLWWTARELGPRALAPGPGVQAGFSGSRKTSTASASMPSTTIPWLSTACGTTSRPIAWMRSRAVVWDGSSTATREARRARSMRMTRSTLCAVPWAITISAGSAITPRVRPR